MLKQFVPLAFASALYFVGCAAAPVDAPYYAELNEFEDINVSWRGCELDEASGELLNPNCQDSPPIILRMDARVTDRETSLPMNNIRIWWNSGYGLVYVLPPEVLEAIDVPLEFDGWREVSEQEGELWAEFAGTFEGDYRPTYHEGYTDRNGLSSVWLWIEQMPRDATGQAVQTGLMVGIHSDTKAISLTPSE